MAARFLKLSWLSLHTSRTAPPGGDWSPFIEFTNCDWFKVTCVALRVQWDLTRQQQSAIECTQCTFYVHLIDNIVNHNDWVGATARPIDYYFNVNLGKCKGCVPLLKIVRNQSERGRSATVGCRRRLRHLSQTSSCECACVCAFTEMDAIV